MGTRKADEQAAFEEWFYDERGYAEFEKDDDGQYSNRLTHWAWEAWKASKAWQATHAVGQRGARRQLLSALAGVPTGLVAVFPDMI